MLLYEPNMHVCTQPAVLFMCIVGHNDVANAIAMQRNQKSKEI